MHKILHLSAVALLAALSLGSCKKAKDNTEVTLVNRAAQEVTFDIYSSMDEYIAGTAPTLRKTIPANNKITLPGGTLAMGKTYYIDWYNADYTIHNWYNDAYPNGQTKVAFKPVVGDNTYYTMATGSGARNIFIGGNRSGSEWEVRDAFLYSTSTGFVSMWDQVPDSQKHQSITISKGFKATLNYQGSDGSMKANNNLTFKVQVAPQGYLELYDAAGNNIGYMISGRLPDGTPPDYTSTKTDSVLALLPNSEMQFLMVKKK